MALAPLSTVLRKPEPERDPMPEGLDVLLGDDSLQPKMEDGALVHEMLDGSAIVDLSPSTKAPSNKFDANLAEEMEESELALIANELLEGIERDNTSRQDWLNTHAEGIGLLGLVLESQRSGTGNTAAPLEGMSTARHPLLLEAVLVFQANARGELLPAAGPVKVRDDQPEESAPPDPAGPNPSVSPFQAPPAIPPGAGAGAPGPAVPPSPPQPAGAQPMPQPSGVPGVAMPQPGDDEEDDRDKLADALEKDFNHYLTTTAQEYYPDTDRMLFSVGFGGQGVKKVYNCPLRRRPVSESIAMEDFIVSDATTDLSNCSRITHRIKMRPSTLRRMQLLKQYRDIEIGDPQQASQPDAVQQKKAEVQGVQPQAQDPKDADYEVYECHCELDLDKFAPKQFKGKGLALPYVATIEKDSQKVLQLRRNWREDDEQCMARETFVEFPYDKAFGWYGIGLVHILGNLTKTLTAAQRITTDNGMFSNFPGFIYAKGAGRQLTNQFRVPPGGGVGLDVGLAKLSDAVMPLPYKPVDAAWAAWQKQMEEMGQRLGGTANTIVAEGRADAPVGTTLALIEQATKPLGAVLKRLHTAQSKEIQLLKDRFREDPEAFWRFNKKPTMPWVKEQFIKALEDFDLVPVSDPNNPTKLHRAAKSAVITQYQTAFPGVLDPRKSWTRVADAVEIDGAEELLAPIMPPAPPAPPDPGKMAMAQAKMKGDELKAQVEMQKAQANARDSAEMRASQERMLHLKIQLEEVKQQGLIEREEVKLAASVATASEKAQQADRHLETKLISEHAHGEAEREHGASEAEADRRHAAELAAVEREHASTQSDAEREHAKDLADKQAKAKIAEIKAKPRPKPAAKKAKGGKK